MSVIALVPLWRNPLLLERSDFKGFSNFPPHPSYDFEEIWFSCSGIFVVFLLLIEIDVLLN